MQSRISVVFSFSIIMLLVSRSTLVHGELFAPKRVDANKVATAKSPITKLP
jgi:hypothetical protein